MNEKWKNLPASCMLKAVFWLFTAAFLVAALISPDRAELISGLQAIYTTPAQVTKDYFEVGSVSAAFANAFLVCLLCSALYMLPGAAANGGLLSADVLTHFDGIPVPNTDVLLSVLESCISGQKVDVDIFRNGEELTFTLTVD